MSNTNVDITCKNSKTWFQNRIHHNNRKTNLSSSDYKENECLNIVEIFAQKSLEQEQKIDEKKRGEISKELSSYKTRLYKYEIEVKKQYQELEKMIVNGEEQTKEFSKLNNKYSRKVNSTIPSLKSKIEVLEQQRNSTIAKPNNSNKRRNDFVEISFSITKAPKELKRDLSYGKDLLNCVKEYHENLGLDMDVQSISLHMDQSSPHVHVLGSYKNSSSNITKDLEQRFNKRYNYHSLQNDFNNFVRNHRAMQKYNHVKELEHITRGGKYEYIKNLDVYKKSSGIGVDKAHKRIEKLDKHIDNLQDFIRTKDLEQDFKDFRDEKVHKKSIEYREEQHKQAMQLKRFKEQQELQAKKDYQKSLEQEQNQQQEQDIEDIEENEFGFDR